MPFSSFFAAADIGAIEHQAVPYDYWAGYSFIPGAPLTGATDDYDGDGVANWVEYYCGSRATSGSSLPDFLHGPASPGVSFIYPLSRVAQPAYAKVQWSINLNNWFSIGFTTTDTGIVNELIQMRASQTVAAPPGRLFWRLDRVP